jgi:hypothetical protein
VRHLDQVNTDHPAQHGDPDATARQHSEDRPGEDGHPDRKRVGQGDDGGRLQLGEGVERHDHAQAAGNRPHPQAARAEEDEASAGRQRERPNKQEDQEGSGDGDRLPAAPLAGRVGQGRHDGERRAPGEHPEVRAGGALRHGRGSLR